MTDDKQLREIAENIAATLLGEDWREYMSNTVADYIEAKLREVVALAYEDAAELSISSDTAGNTDTAKDKYIAAHGAKSVVAEVLRARATAIRGEGK